MDAWLFPVGSNRVNGGIIELGDIRGDGENREKGASMKNRMNWKVWLVLAIASCSWGQAQSFSSGSTGSDGALNFSSPGTYDFDPTTYNPPLNPKGDNVFHFTTINIAFGVTLRLRASKLREQSVVWLATGSVTIAGTLDLGGAADTPKAVRPACACLPNPVRADTREE